MAKSKILYSTNSRLSFVLAEKFYGGVHYAWCSPYFSPLSAPAYTNVPPTSSPFDIYHNLFNEVMAGDRHSAKIESNRKGLLKGVAVRLAAGIIDVVTSSKVTDIISQASIPDFRPVVYVIPAADVSALMKEVPIIDRAHPLAEEYIISELHRSMFDVIELS